MQNTGSRRTIALAFVVCLLVPSLIYSDGHHDLQVKLPPAKTAGTAPAEYTLTPHERDKLFTVLPTSLHSASQLPHRDKAPSPTPAVGYTGPTAAELMKRQRESDYLGLSRRLGEREPVSTIEIVPRPPGPEGLTEAERAKLEAWMKLQSKDPSSGGRGSK